MKKLLVLALAALGGIVGASHSVAEAQWYETRAPTYSTYDNGAWRATLASAAHTLSDEAGHVAHYLRAADGTSHLADNALALSRSAELFHRMVEAGAPLTQLAYEFRDLEREQAYLVRTLGGAHHVHHDSHFNQDWAQLQQAYATAARILQTSAQPSPHHAYPSYTYPQHGYAPQYAYVPQPQYVQPRPPRYRVPRGRRWQVRVGF